MIINVFYCNSGQFGIYYNINVQLINQQYLIYFSTGNIQASKINCYNFNTYILTTGTVYDLGRRNLSALSTEHSLHQGLNRLIGTTGRGQMAQEIHQAIHQYLLNRDLPSALRLQILADYAAWGGIEEYYSGLQRLIRHQEGLLRRDGQPFLNQQEAQAMLHWLQQQVTRFCNATRNGQANSYLGDIEEEIIRYM